MEANNIKQISINLIEFLLLNGFLKIDDFNFSNNKCAITILENCYEIYSEKWSDLKGSFLMTTNSFSIYELIGILTYYKFIDKNYKIKIK